MIDPNSGTINQEGDQLLFEVISKYGIFGQTTLLCFPLCQGGA